MSSSLNISASSEVLLTHKIYLLTFQESISSTTRSWKSSRKTSPRNVLSCSNKSVKMLRTSRSSMNNSARTSSSVSTKTATTETSSANSWDITLPSQENNSSVSKSTSQEWKKDKRISTLSLDNLELLPLLLPSSRPLERETSKSSTWLTQSTNTSSSNWRTSTDINLRMPPKKDSNSITLKTKRRESKNKRLHSKVSASSANRSWEIKSKKFKSVKDSANLHAPWSLDNTDGQPTCNVSWKLKPWGIKYFIFRDSSMSNYMVSKKTM